MSSSKYCNAATKNVEERPALDGKRLPTKCKTPMVTKYAPEMDVTAELKAYLLHFTIKSTTHALDLKPKPLVVRSTDLGRDTGSL